MKIDQYIDELIRKEGGYVNHPNDRGGPTNWGITEQVARAWGYRGDMKTLPRQTAVEIYKSRYWVQPKFDQVNRLSPAIAEELLDTGVNMGPGVASRFLQRALNTLNVQESRFPDISVDGAIGQMTLNALDTFLKWRGKDAETVMLRMLNAQQSVRYMEIAERDKKQESFQFGWQLHRVS
jgi:lysozyme family protein